MEWIILFVILAAYALVNQWFVEGESELREEWERDLATLKIESTPIGNGLIRVSIVHEQDNIRHVFEPQKLPASVWQDFTYAIEKGASAGRLYVEHRGREETEQAITQAAANEQC